jgi:hypothetical protein
VLTTSSPWFERSVHHDSLSEAQVEKLRVRATKLGMQTLTQLHTLAAQPADENDQSQSGPKKRFTCGVYFYSTDAAEATTEK